MPQYRTRDPATVEAVQFAGPNIGPSLAAMEQAFGDAVVFNRLSGAVQVRTGTGQLVPIRVGDYVVRTQSGGLCVWSAEQFEKRFEVVAKGDWSADPIACLARMRDIAHQLAGATSEEAVAKSREFLRETLRDFPEVWKAVDAYDAEFRPEPPTCGVDHGADRPTTWTLHLSIPADVTDPDEVAEIVRDGLAAVKRGEGPIRFEKRGIVEDEPIRVQLGEFRHPHLDAARRELDRLPNLDLVRARVEVATELQRLTLETLAAIQKALDLVATPNPTADEARNPVRWLCPKEDTP